MWPLVVEAILQSKITLRTLDLPTIESNGFTGLAANIMTGLSASLRSLETLSVGANIPSKSAFARLWQKSFASFLSVCQNVSSLRIKFDSLSDEGGLPHYETEPCLGTLAAWPTFKRLKFLDLSTMEVEPQYLVEFLGRHRNTLKELNVYVPWFGLDPGGWRTVLGYLAKGFSLDALQFSVYTGENEYELVRSKGSKLNEEIAEALSTGYGRTMSSQNVQRMLVDGNG